MSGRGQDSYSLIKRVKAFGWYVALVSQMPWLHKVFQDNIVLRKTKPSPFMQAIHTTVSERLNDAKSDPEAARPDLLSHFIAAHAKYPLMDRKQVLIFSSGNLLAGGLSPGRGLDCLCQHLATYPEIQEKLYAELVQAHFATPAPFDDVKDLPYLEGVVREAYRLNGNASFNLQRVTSPGGMELPNGCHLPAGIQVGGSAESINKDVRIWGLNADSYKPERWMRGKDESENSYQERRKHIDKTDLTFGQGSRTCIGKSIAALEFFKVVATLMITFQVGGSQSFLRLCIQGTDYVRSSS